MLSNNAVACPASQRPDTAFCGSSSLQSTRPMKGALDLEAARSPSALSEADTKLASIDGSNPTEKGEIPQR